MKTATTSIIILFACVSAHTQEKCDTLANSMYRQIKSELAKECDWDSEVGTKAMQYAEWIAMAKINSIDSSQCTFAKNLGSAILNGSHLKNIVAESNSTEKEGWQLGVQKTEQPRCKAWLAKILNSKSDDSFERGKSKTPIGNNQNNNPLANQSRETMARAAEMQAKADAQARRAGRRTHDPAAEASECIEPNFAPLYGGMKNKCAFKVHYTYCGSKPEEKSWLKEGLNNCRTDVLGCQFLVFA